MYRDIRDPQAIGAALETQRAHSANAPISQLADKVLADPTIRNYGEKNAAYADRIDRQQGYRRNVQLAMFRSA